MAIVACKFTNSTFVVFGFFIFSFGFCEFCILLVFLKNRHTFVCLNKSVVSLFLG